MNKKLFFLDAETDGLYGAFLTVAVIVTDEEGNPLEQAYYGIKKDKLQISDVWTRENVLPILGRYEECEDEKELLEKVWALWRKYAGEAYAIADVIFPVEARLFATCVAQDPVNRKFQAPYPMLDLSSLLYAKGYDPLIERELLLKEKDADSEKLTQTEAAKEHNALFDVQMSIELYKKLFVKNRV